MSRYLLLFYIFSTFLFNQNISAQNKVDSLKAIWTSTKKTDSVRFLSIRRYYFYYSDAQPDSALAVSDYHYQLGKEKNAYKQMIYALLEESDIYRVKGEYDKAMTPLIETFELATQNNDSLAIADTHLSMGNIFISENDFQSTIKKYSDALNIYRALKREVKEAAILTNLGTLYNVIGYEELAFKNYNEARIIYENVPSKEPGLIACYHNIGRIYYDQKKYADAIGIAEKALKKIEGQSQTYQECLFYSLLAECYHALDEIDIAFSHARKSLAFAKQLNNNILILSQRRIIANLTFENNIPAATVQTESILNDLTPSTLPKFGEDVYTLLYKCYKAQGKSGKSLEMYELAKQYADTTQQQKNKFAATREAIKNNLEEELRQTEIDNKKAQASLKATQTKRTAVIVGVALLIIVLIITYFGFKARQNRKTREALLNELNTLKNESKPSILTSSDSFELNREKIELSIGRPLNETDWKVLNIILEDPVIPNKKIAEKVFMSVDGIGSSLRRMYEYFEIKETKYKKISLLTDSIKRSKSA